MRNRGAQISISVICIILGIMLAYQFKTTQSYQAAKVPQRVEDLATQLNSVTVERDELKEKTTSLGEQLSNLRTNNQATADLQRELQAASMAAGLLPVEGAGITVTLNDNPNALQVGENPNTSLVHDSDLLTVVNELKASGAEAISINGQRITAMSEIRCAGTMILVNSNKIGPPFVITAIGDPDMLESGILIKGGYIDTTLKVLGIQTNVQKGEKLKIPAYSGVVKFNYGVQGH